MPYDFLKLKAGRERMGLNKDQLARQLRVSGQLIVYIERGERQHPPTIKAFAKAVKVPMADLVISDDEFEALREREVARRA